jgi:hypothetical protein
LGECLKRQGRYTDSERTYRELVASIDDKSSYESLCARSSLGQVLLETNPKEAERVHREVVETAVRVLDPESIQVLSFTGDLALAILYNQRFEEARSMLAPLVERMCRILGPVHPDTLTTKGNLALALHLLGPLGRHDMIASGDVIRLWCVTHRFFLSRSIFMISGYFAG